MRTDRTVSLSLLLLWACNGDTTATTGTDEPDTTPDGTTGTGVPTTGVGDTGEPTAATDTGDTTESTDPGTGETPPVDCPETTPAPTDCGREPETCGNATPIAGGPGVYLDGAALTRDHVYFAQNTGMGCPRSLFRAPRTGGDAQWVRLLDDTLDFEADDDALYLVERTRDPHTMRISARVDDVEAVLGETHGDRDFNSYFYTFLTRTRAGVVTHDSGGQQHPPFFHLTPTALTLVGSRVDDEYLGSNPAYDGERLFYSLNDPTFDDEPGHVSVHRQLVGVADGVSVVLAENAAARGSPTVALDGPSVYFATGDPSEGMMGISRVAKSGGPATPLFPSADVWIDKLLVDDTHVYYHQAPHDIFAVEKTGGEPRHVWHGAHEVDSARIQQDADNLYFAVHGGGGDIPPPGHDFIVRVAKTTTLP